MVVSLFLDLLYLEKSQRYKPLDLPPILHDLPANYTNNLPRLDGENVNITAKKHIQRF
jgi:hypothetical protein